MSVVDWKIKASDIYTRTVRTREHTPMLTILKQKLKKKKSVNVTMEEKTS